MNPERWKKIEDIFQTALDLPAAERQPFINEQCGADAELRAEVEKFVALYQDEDSFLESPAWTDSQLLESGVKREIASSLEKEIAESDPSENFIGRQIGVYELIEELGRGGMGVVYRAERTDGEFKQKVAIKLIKRGMDTDFIIRRFRNERQIAASLNHPNIARLLDGGTTTDGLPYFVLEYIDGKPFFKYAEANKLDLRARLELFLRVCSALIYAHQQKIIHRDIKPGNILVAADGEPKLLDFGIAKILDPDLIHESVIPTATQMRLMTPEYASPEQVRGDEITPATDQYSLGILLYELLTGNRPYKFLSRAPHEVARIICEEIPAEPSGGELGGTADSDLIVNKNGLQKLDRIVLKALRKDLRERYPSVKDFAADIERFLRSEPIKAESYVIEKTPAEPARKSIETEPTTSGQKSIAVLPFKMLDMVTEADTGDIGFLGIGLADSLITRLSNVKKFLVRPTSSVLRFNSLDSDPFVAGKELSVNYVLDGNILKTGKRIRVSIQLINIVEQSIVWADRFDEDVTDVLSLEDSISQRVAESLVPQLSTGEVQNLAKRATDKPEAYEAYLRGRVFWNTFTENGLRKAIEYYRKAIEIDPAYAQAHAAIADYYVWLGMYGLLPVGEFYPQATKAASRAIELDPGSSEAYAALGLADLYGKYDWVTSEKNMRRAIELNPNNSVAHLWYTHNLHSQKRFAEGDAHLQRAIELDPMSFQNINMKAWNYYFERRFDEALAQADELIEIFPVAGFSHFAKSCYLRVTGQTEQSLELSFKTLELSDDVLFTHYGHAAALAAVGRKQEALEIIENPKPSQISAYHTAIVYCYLKEKEKAFELLERSFTIRESGLIWVGAEPGFDFIRSDSRYQLFLKMMNHPLAESANLTSLPDTEKTTVSDAAPNFSEAATVIQSFPKTKGGKSNTLVYVLAAIVLAVIGLGLYYAYYRSVKASESINYSDKSWRNSFASMMNARRLTNSGTELLSAISSDGMRIAFVSQEDEKHSLWLRSTDKEDTRQIVAPSANFIISLLFAPDGKYIYYTTVDQNYAERRLYRVDSSGTGDPQKIQEGVSNGIGISPDGKRIAYFNFDSEKRQTQLIVADLHEDGTLGEPKYLATRNYPNYFPANPAFSPDGKRIIYPAGTLDEQEDIVNIYSVNPETGVEEKICLRDFYNIAGVQWHGGADEIVITGNERNTEPQQLWSISVATGEAVRMTNDLSEYYNFSFTKDSSMLIAVRGDIKAYISTIKLNTVNGSTETESAKLSDGVNRIDGTNGVFWTADNHILYISSDRDKNTIISVNADGTKPTAINTGDSLPTNPLLTPDGKYLFYLNEKGNKSIITRYEISTGSVRSISSPFAATPALTPDGKFIIYSAFDQKGRRTLHQVSVDGGASVEITGESTLTPIVSPDNKFIACYWLSKESTQIAVFPIEGGSPVQMLKTPDTVNLLSPNQRPLAWSVDSRAIYYLNDKNGVSNICRISLSDGKIEQMTHFSSGRIFDFALSPDSQQAVLSRGTNTSDIVVFSNL